MLANRTARRPTVKDRLLMAYLGMVMLAVVVVDPVIDDVRLWWRRHAQRHAAPNAASGDTCTCHIGRPDTRAEADGQLAPEGTDERNNHG